MLPDGTLVTVIDWNGRVCRMRSLANYASSHDNIGGIFSLHAHHEGITWARGHGDDVEAALLLVRSARAI